ncbi:MAG TPA: NUDIX domain-containing protein [Gaiellaceae bacterium]|nr:NUDIX domain-containing protein [Gaiellaceae bacterium]
MSDYIRRLREQVGHDFILMPSVAALVHGDDGRILLVRHVEGRWQLPGGAVDPDERPADALRREAREEARVELEPRDVLGVFGGPEYRVTYANGDDAGWVVAVYAARIAGGTPTPGDPDEIQEVGWFTPAEIATLELHPSTRRTIELLLGEPAHGVGGGGASAPG